MSSDRIQQIIGQPEGESLEYKQVVPPPAVIAREIAAFANTKGGFLIFGVDDNLKIVGLEEDVPATAVVESALARLTPRPLVKQYSLNIESKRVHILEIERASTFIKTEGGNVYMRVSDRLRKEQGIPRFKPPEEPIGECEKRLHQLLEQVTRFARTATESGLRFFDKYHDLLRLVDLSGNVLHFDFYTISRGKALSRLIFSDFVNTFEVYLADLLLEIYLAKPNTLKSKSTVTVEEVLECRSIEEFVRFEANRRVQKLKRGDLNGFVASLKKSTGLDVFQEAEIVQVEDVFQIRHLYTHNNGRVDAEFLAKSHNVDGWALGDEHLVSFGELCETAELFLKTVKRLDDAAIAKYHLAGSNIEESS